MPTGDKSRGLLQTTGSAISSFKGKYHFLSNFYTAPVTYNGMTFQNNEAAFQAQKTLDESERLKFVELSPSDAKRLGRRIKLRPDWETVKEDIMYGICFAKFTQNPDLKTLLLSTGTEFLEEGNNWGDREWGTVNGVGNNKLGKTLMKIREELRKEK